MTSCAMYGVGPQHQAASLPVAMLIDQGEGIDLEQAVEDIQTCAGGSAFQSITKALNGSGCTFRR